MASFMNRPKSGETEDDLLKQQADFNARQNKPSVTIHKVQRKSAELTGKEPDNPVQETSQNVQEQNQKPVKVLDPEKVQKGARFALNLEDIQEELDTVRMFAVQEKNTDYLTSVKSSDLPDSSRKLEFSRSDGFPEVLDLSPYFDKNLPETERRKATKRKSFFAAEFDRLRGKIEESLVCDREDDGSEMASTSTSWPDDFRVENDKYLSNLSKEKIEEMQLEIKERLDPKTIQFLLEKRKRIEQSGQSTEPVKISKFKRQKLETQNLEKQVEATKNESQKLVQFKEDEIPKEEPSSNEVVAEMIKQLEVLDEFGDRTDLEKYNRLATDAYQMDIASKVLRGIVPRQLQNAVKLFDSCKFPLNGKPSSDPIIEMARSKIDEIKLLYLEDIQMENGSIVQTFAKGFNPLVDGAWTLVPIRKVVDAIDARQGQVTSDDVEIVRLALLFTYLLFDERKTAFYAFADPPEIYVRLAEVFVIGSEILEDDVIIHCAHKLTILYLQKAAIEGRLALRMTTKIAGLDAFMPFYEDLLKKYEEYSFGNVLFAKILLIGAYLNSATSDG
ncbi:hypothetical protein WR25_05718 isoform C [Diploscapter pachys]|nr:hypothetical protein WR25_05718 isoform B [Diploscapter pachys]PAV89302.1 hypothetical protein WR25_05718 isoform C [Diploscapter pachys]